MKHMDKEALIRLPDKTKVMLIEIEVTIPKGVVVSSREVLVTNRFGITPAENCNMNVNGCSIKHIRFFESEDFEPISFCTPESATGVMYCLKDNEYEAVHHLKKVLDAILHKQCDRLDRDSRIGQLLHHTLCADVDGLPMKEL